MTSKDAIKTWEKVDKISRALRKLGMEAIQAGSIYNRVKQRRKINQLNENFIEEVRKIIS